MHVARGTVALAAVGGLVLAGGTGGAVAARLIDSSDIRNDSIRSVDVKDGTLKQRDLHDRLVGKIKDGVGPAGPAGPRGPAGAPGPAGPPGPAAANAPDVQVVVSNLSGAFTNTNPSVSLTPDGVEFGPYADGGAAGGSVCYDGLNGDPLSTVHNLAYNARFAADNDTGGVGVPYLRVFTDNGAGGENSAIFSPNTQAPDPDIDEGEFNEWVATSGTWRYNDDVGAGPETPWAQIEADHGTEPITALCITVGFSNGTNLQGLLRWWEINGETFVFRG